VDELNGLGATLIAVSPELGEHSRALIEEKRLRFEILRDPGNEVAHAYGSRWVVPDDLKELYKTFGIDLTEVNGDTSWTLPLPGCFILDRVGVVQYARVDPDYTRRPEPQETLSCVRSLSE